MFVDFSAGPDWGAYDFVIIGAGPAGLLLAEKFAGRGRVLVLEAGGRDLARAQGAGYYDLDVTGRGYASLGRRLSVVGGTSNHWGGHSHPLSPSVFENRPGFPGWPIAYADYALHLKEAQDWLNLGDFDKERGQSGVERDLLGHAQNLEALHFQFSNPLRHFGDAPTQDRYATVPGIDIVLDARVTDLMLDDGRRVASLEVMHLPSGATATVPVKLLFLAAGGIDTPRLMLWAARKYQAGNPLAGGPSNLTGKYFMEHPSIMPVEIYIDARADITALAPHLDTMGRMVNVALRPTDEFLAAHGLPRFAMHFQETAQPATTDVEILSGQDFYVSRSTAYSRIMPFFLFEQTPDAASFVGLSETKRGKDGTPLARLNWHIADEEVQAYRRSVQMFCGLLNQHGLAKARFVGDAANPDWSKLGFGDSAHHMGTTRMAHTASGGVVDSNCQVFGLDNMFVAGSAVFPTSDIVNPTLNLTALTARLANFVLTRQATAVGVTYRFGSGRDADKALGKGWAQPVFEGVWSNGDVSTVTLERKGAATLTFAAAAAGGATVELQINGASVYRGPANALAGKALPTGDQEKLALSFQFADLPAATPDASGKADGPHGLFLQSVTLK